jgi:hypothetical protein
MVKFSTISGSSQQTFIDEITIFENVKRSAKLVEREQTQKTTQSFEEQFSQYRIGKLEKKIIELENRFGQLKNQVSGTIKIQHLPHHSLKIPLDVIVEPDDIGFIARTIDLPLYAHSENDSFEAVEALKDEIESLYEDLLEDDDFTPEFLRIKKFLKRCIEK